MTYLTDDDAARLIDALRANRNNPSGRHNRLLAAAEAIIRRHRAEALRGAAVDWSDWDALISPEDWLLDRADDIEADE